MQNTSHSQLGSKATGAITSPTARSAASLAAVSTASRKVFALDGRKAAAIAIFLICLAFAMLMAAPAQAEAKSYTCPKVDITANASTDGSLDVVEQRTFDFDGDFTAVWWVFDGIPDNGTLKVNGVSLTKIDDEGMPIGESTQLSETSFNLDWREAGGPGTDAYSVDSPKNSVYVFFHASDEKMIITLDYTIVNGIVAYKDVADLYWKYVGDQWEIASENVTLTVNLPVPQDGAVVAGETVRAWGHGPLDGTVTINGDGSVVYKNPQVNPGQYAEARVAFPVEWLTNLKGEESLANRDKNYLDTILSEEQAWSDQANRDRVFSLAFVIGCGIIAVLLIAWALRLYFKYGREHKPEFTEEYWRDVPSKLDHPVVMARLWRWNRESNDDFTATLMHLSHLGAIQINKGSYEQPASFGRTKTVNDYYLTRVPAVAETLTDPIDRIAMGILFGQIAGGADSLWFGTIQQYGKDNPEEFVDALQSWQGIVTAAVNRRDFFEMKGERYQWILLGVAIAFGVIGVGLSVVMQNFIPLIFVVPAVIALLVIANYMPRRSQEGSTLDAKCKALRHWLKDFSALDERPPTDVKVWGEFMVYAFIFGIADEVIKALQLKVPELFQDDGMMYSSGYVPWWFWYSTSYGAHGAAMPSASALFQTSIANTVSTAQAAVSAAEGNFSSGGGFGGGFSGGGGGGAR